MSSFDEIKRVVATMRRDIESLSIQFWSAHLILEPHQADEVSVRVSPSLLNTWPQENSRLHIDPEGGIAECSSVSRSFPFHAYSEITPACYMEDRSLVVPQLYGQDPVRLLPPPARERVHVGIPVGFTGEIFVWVKAFAIAELSPGVSGTIRLLKAENGGMLKIRARGPYGQAGQREFEGEGKIFQAQDGHATTDGCYAFRFISPHNGWYSPRMLNE